MMDLKRRIKELDNVEITCLSSMVVLLSIVIFFTLFGYYMRTLEHSIVMIAAFIFAYSIAMMAAFVFILTVMDYKDYKAD